MSAKFFDLFSKSEANVGEETVSDLSSDSFNNRYIRCIGNLSDESLGAAQHDVGIPQRFCMGK